MQIILMKFIFLTLKIEFVKIVDNHNLLFKVNEDLETSELISIKGLYIKDYNSEYNSKLQKDTYPVVLDFSNHYIGKSLNENLFKRWL